MSNNKNIIILKVTPDKITLNIDGQIQEIPNTLEALKLLLDSSVSKTIQTANKIINIGSINEANFNFLMGQVEHKAQLPEDLAQQLITDDNIWVKSLQQELIRQRVAVGNKPWEIFKHYGWLIETFLQKMGTAPGRKRTLRRLSFMTEAFQSSLRYLCYIQVAQILQMDNPPQNKSITEFLWMPNGNDKHYDYLNLLLVTTAILQGEDSFMLEVEDFVDELKDTEDDLYATTLFLEKHRNLLLSGKIEQDESLNQLLDEYLTALVYWLRRISFLAKYRLVSIKDINLKYQLGTTKNFVHLYGELNGIYSESLSIGEDYNVLAIQDVFTFNQSILLFKGNNVETCLKNIKDPDSYLSLSPLIIDQSVYSEKQTQTPEIYYFIGHGKRQYNFAQYKNELKYEKTKVRNRTPNKFLRIKRQNNRQPKLDELYDQLEKVFAPIKMDNQ
jgi:hypothetical protein